jgi:hypothetical protein
MTIFLLIYGAYKESVKKNGLALLVARSPLHSRFTLHKCCLDLAEIGERDVHLSTVARSSLHNLELYPYNTLYMHMIDVWNENMAQNQNLHINM